MRDDRDVTVIETESGSGFKWFLLGAAIGAGLGVLFAPQSGERTRRALGRRAQKLRETAGDKIDDLAEDIADRGQRIKDRVEDFAEGVVDDFRDGGRRVQRASHTAREEMQGRLSEARARRRAAVNAGGVADDDTESDDSPA